MTTKTKKFSNPNDLILYHFENGKDKDFIATALFEAGHPFTTINKLIKESGVKFRKTGLSTWKYKMANAFLANPDASPDEINDVLQGYVKDPMYYIKAYYDVFQYMAKQSVKS